CPDIAFNPIVTSDLPLALKPAPDGLLHILERHPDAEPVYLGDTVDDARAARAAKVPFIGVAAWDAPHREETIALFRQEGARAIVESISAIQGALERLHAA